jgi:hypothetical protein
VSILIVASIVVCATIMVSRVPANERCPTCGSSVRDGTNCPGCHKVAQIAVLRANILALENSTEEEPYPAHTYDSVVHNTTAGPALSSILLSGASTLQLGQVNSTMDEEMTYQPSFISRDALSSRSSGTVTSFSTSLMSRSKPLAGAGSEARQQGLNLVQRWGLAGDSTIWPVSATMSAEDLSKLIALVPKDFLEKKCDHEAILTKRSLLRATFTASPNFAHYLQHFKQDVSLVGKRFREFVRLSMKTSLLETASRCLQESGYDSVTRMRSIEDMYLDLKRGPIRKDGSWDANWNEWHGQLVASHTTSFSKTGGDELLILAHRSMEAMGIAYCQDEDAGVRPNRSLGSFKAVANKVYGNVLEWLRHFGDVDADANLSSIKQGPGAAAAYATVPHSLQFPVGGFPVDFPVGGFPLLPGKTEMSCGWDEIDGRFKVEDNDSLILSGNDMTGEVPGAIDVLACPKKPVAVDANEEEAHRMPAKGSEGTPVPTSTVEGTLSNDPAASTRKIGVLDQAPPAKTKAANDIKPEPAPGVSKVAVARAKAAAKARATKAAAVQKRASVSEPPKVKDVSVAEHNEQVEVPAPTALVELQAGSVVKEKHFDTESEKSRQKELEEHSKQKPPDVEVKVPVQVPVADSNPKDQVVFNSEPKQKLPEGQVPVEVQVEVEAGRRVEVQVEVEAGRRICANPKDHIIFQAGQYKSETNGAYSFVDGVACEGCRKEGTPLAGQGTDYICPTKADPVWVCATCEGNLHCNDCFRREQKQFDLDYPNGCKRSRVRKRKSF